MLLINTIYLLTFNFKNSLKMLKKTYISLLANIFEILFLYFVFSLILSNFDHTNWNGINEDDDNTFYKKFFNRFYFTSTTYSTAGYGDISPKSIRCRIVVMILQTLIILEIVNLSVHIKPTK